MNEAQKRLAKSFFPPHENGKALILHECPTCHAKEGDPCRMPDGREKVTIHDTRPSSIGEEPVMVIAEHKFTCRMCPRCGDPYYIDGCRGCGYGIDGDFSGSGLGD